MVVEHIARLKTREKDRVRKRNNQAVVITSSHSNLDRANYTLERSYPAAQKRGREERNFEIYLR